MTFYEWIRLCLSADAEKHPIPKVCKQKLNGTIRRIRREQRKSMKKRAAVLK